MGNLHGTNRNPAGELQFPSLATGKKVTQRKFTEMPVTEVVIKQVEEMAVKGGAVKGINFKQYKFDNDKEYKMLVEPNKPAPFPDIQAEVLCMLTELKEEYESMRWCRTSPRRAMSNKQ